MLDLSYAAQQKRDLEELLVDSDVFGLAFFGDGATIHKCPLINVFASSSSLNAPAVLINIVDCTDRLVSGENK